MSEREFYLCLFCFECYDHERECHGRPTLCCDIGGLDDERRRPPVDGAGRLQAREPRWFLEAMGWLPDQPGGVRSVQG
jgi:hypothetical protein